MLCGVSIKPNTAVDTLFALLDEDKRLREEEGLDGLVDLVLIMTVEPGFGGQAFMSEMMAKVQVLRERYPNLPIEVDGGLGPSTIEEVFFFLWFFFSPFNWLLCRLLRRGRR